MHQKSAPETIEDRILSGREVSAFTGLHPVTLWRLWNDPQSGFPKPLKLTKVRNGWRLSAIEAWLERRAEQRDTAA